MLDSPTTKGDAGDARGLTNLALRLAGVLVAATLVFMGLYYLVLALD